MVHRRSGLPAGGAGRSGTLHTDDLSVGMRRDLAAAVPSRRSEMAGSARKRTRGSPSGLWAAKPVVSAGEFRPGAIFSLTPERDLCMIDRQLIWRL